MMQSSPLPITYISDAAVDEALDLELRALLSQSFTGAPDSVFEHRRYFNEPPAHRWIVRGNQGILAAHLAIHEKTVTLDGEEIRFGGVSEVCVRDEFRGQKLVKQLLAEAHRWLSQHDYPFAALFGKPIYYGSSGYVAVDNVFQDSVDEQGNPIRKRAEGFLVAQLSTRPWPGEDVFLPGKSF